MADALEESRRQIKQTWKEFSQELSLKNAKIARLNYQLEQRQKLDTCAKLRYILEMLEEISKPENITSEDWEFKTSRAAKWDIIFRSDKKHPLANEFINCIQNCCSRETEAKMLLECQETVRYLFDVCDSNINAYYQNVPIIMEIFNSPRIEHAVLCLTSLEAEIRAYSKTSSSSK